LAWHKSVITLKSVAFDPVAGYKLVLKRIPAGEIPGTKQRQRGESMTTYDQLFKAATGLETTPYPYQKRLAEVPAGKFPQLLDIPTGLGKTAAVILAWLWRRRFTDDQDIRQSTPRRLVYCLPMRVLVEQTRENARKWISNLVQAGLLAEPVPEVHVLMGGEEADEWDLYPECDAILIGTQDMLLSRALNRGYAMSRYRWPMHFGLLHTDSLWVFDEIQLMGSGLATTAQLQAFRNKLRQNCCASLWMSATLRRDWLKTVDFNPAVLSQSALEDDDLQTGEVRQRREARKPIQAATARMDDPTALAKQIAKAHVAAGGRTLAVVNTVKRARELFQQLRRDAKSTESKPDFVLIHSRFRPEDRRRQVERLLAEPGKHGMIVVSTQVVEAGVDVSATTLFTELAPWASVVQRFGRCNRRGTDNDKAQVFWIDLPSDEKLHEKLSAPYQAAELEQSRLLLKKCENVGPASLPGNVELRHERGQVLRHKDFIELFDTTPDLAGNDIDIERYVREVDECDVQVFWRDWHDRDVPSNDMAAPRHEELCSVPVGEFRDFARDVRRNRLMYRWDHLEEQWAQVDPNRIFPGQIYMLHITAGGYSTESGWDAKSSTEVAHVTAPQPASPMESNDADHLSESAWQSIAQHTNEVCKELDDILAEVSVSDADALKLAARWHDRGKAHEVFQQAICVTRGNGQHRPDASANRTDIAKAPKAWWRKYSRKHFRHELASALAVLTDREVISADLRDLVAYLAASHHGKVRLSIRSLPEEIVPDGNRRFARGVWEGDSLPATDLGNNVTAPAVTLSLEPMELGLCEKPPFAGQPSWAERMLRLRDVLGPFRLAYLEAILRAADWRASMTMASSYQVPSGADTTTQVREATATASYAMSHQALDDLALDYFRAIAAKIRRDPSLLRIPLDNIKRWREQGSIAPGAEPGIQVWERLIKQGDIETLTKLMTDPGEQGVRWRQYPVFVGILTPAESAAIRRQHETDTPVETA
jgi:CRISPR-associated endonuclease/helicase Cas3